MRRVLAIVLAIALMFSYLPAAEMSVSAATKKPLKFSKKKVTINLATKKTKTIKLKVTKKFKKKFKWSGKVKWKITKGKKLISIKKKGKYKNKIKITGKKVGNAKIRAKYKGKKYTLKVKVINDASIPEPTNPTQAQTSQSQEQTVVPTTEDSIPITVGPVTVQPTTQAPQTQATTRVTTQAPQTQATTRATTTAQQTTTRAATTAQQTTTRAATTAAPTTANPETLQYTPVAGSNEYFYNTNNNAKEIVNIQKPGFAAEEGIYVTVSSGISKVTVNGQDNGFAVDGAGVVVYLTSLTQTYNEVVIKHAEGTSSVIIKKDKQATTQAPQTQATTRAATTAKPGETTTHGEISYDFDPSTLNYEKMSCEGGDDLYYAVYKDVVGRVPFYENAGQVFSMMFSGDLGAANSVLVNGNQPSEGVIVENTVGVIRVNPTKLGDNEYSVVKATFENGEVFIYVIKKGNPGEVVVSTTAQQTTTQQVTTQQPTTTAQPTTEAPTQPPVEEMPEREVKQNVDLMAPEYYDGLDKASCTDQGSGSETMEELFDNNVNTKFFTWDIPIRISWKMKEAVIVKNYSLITAGDTVQYHRNPTKWQLYGSNDATTWIQLDAREGGMVEADNRECTFDTTVRDSYQYFMLQITDRTYVNGGSYGVQLSGIKLHGDVAPATSTLGGSLNYFDSILNNETTLSGNGTNEGVAKLFDGDKSTKMLNVGTGSVAWKMNSEMSVYSYTLKTANDNETYPGRNPQSWYFYGSTNGRDWVKLDAVTNSGIENKNFKDYTYTVNKVGKYSYYKIDFKSLQSGLFQLSEISLNGAAVSPSKYDIMFYKDWNQITNKNYVKELIKLFYNSYPRLYKRWGTGTEPTAITFMADKDYDGVAYCQGTTVCVSVDYANGHPNDIGFFSHEITHSVQQYGGKLNYGGDSYWFTENMANYGGFRYFHWSNPKFVQVYSASDTSLQDWGYQNYGNNKWFFAYMDYRYPTTKDGNGNKKLGLLDSLNKLIKENNTGTEYNDNPYTVGSPFNNVVKEITGYDCIESLRKRYVQELQQGTWTFTGFGNYSDNWVTEDIEGIANPTYPMLGEKTHGNTVATKLGTAVTSGTNLCSGATVLETSGFINDNESAAKFIDGNLNTKWCATMDNVSNGTYRLSGSQHFIQIDLGSEKTFNTYTLYNTSSKEGYGNAVEWEVSISNDGENWTPIDYRSYDNDAISSFDVGTRKARYVMFNVFNADNGGSGTARLYEFQLYNR